MRKIYFVLIGMLLSGIMFGQGMNVMHNGNRATYASGGGGASYPSVLDDGNTEAWYIAESQYITEDVGVETWEDITTGGYDLTQSTDANQPQFANDSVSFDGAGDAISNGSISISQPVTIYAAMIVHEYVSSDEYFDLGSMEFEADNSVGLYPGDSIRTRLNAGALFDGPYLPEDDIFILCVVFNGANTLARVDDNAAVTDDAGASAASGLTIATGDQRMALKELIVRSSADSESDQDDVIDYLNGKYPSF